ncbi:MAG: BatA domain-containing protein [Melioribacteraceae bacterium]|nr:BatA domain-containing protein [Melioribacteraceae bacterium]
MIFLNPTVLFGLLAASIPVLIHLLNLRKLKKIEFSTLAFLKELQKTKIRRIKLKQWILLALRILLILLLVSAFARPTIESVTLGGASSAAKTSSVIILDNSFSMSKITDKGSYFNIAKATAKRLIDNLNSGDNISVLATADGRQDLIGYANPEHIKSLVDNIEISDRTFSAEEALLRAVTILNESKDFNKEIYFLSDFQNSSFPQNAMTELEIENPELVKFYTFNFDGRGIDNIAITDLSVNNQIFELNKTIEFNAELKNFSERDFDNLVVSLFINGERSAQKSTAITSGQTVNVNFETVLTKSGVLDVIAEIEDDDILHDNKRYLNISVPEKFNVLIAYENKSDAHFLTTALNYSADEEQIQTDEIFLKNILSKNLNEFDVLFIIAGKEEYSYKDLLEDYLKTGGKIVIIPSSNAEQVYLNDLMQRFDLGTIVSLVELSREEKPIKADSFDELHPMFTNLFETEKRDFNPPEFYKYFRTKNSPSSGKIISFEDKSPFLLQKKDNSGALFLFTSSLTLDWNDFPLKGLFAPLIIKSVFYLTQQKEIEEKIIAGMPVSVDLRKKNSPQIKVSGPDDMVEFITSDTLTCSGFLQYNNTSNRGFYKFYSGDKLIDFKAVNVDKKESETNFLMDDEIEKFISETGFKNVFPLDIESNYIEDIYQSRFGLELWKYFLIAALIVALIEMYVSKSSKKDLATLENN